MESSEEPPPPPPPQEELTTGTFGRGVVTTIGVCGVGVADVVVRLFGTVMLRLE